MDQMAFPLEVVTTTVTADLSEAAEAADGRKEEAAAVAADGRKEEAPASLGPVEAVVQEPLVVDQAVVVVVVRVDRVEALQEASSGLVTKTIGTSTARSRRTYHHGTVVGRRIKSSAICARII